MRSFRKGTPPVEVHEEARNWQQEHEQSPALLDDTRHVRSRFNQLDKRSSQAALCNEQVGLCAFCLRRIRPRSPVLDPSGTRLAHVVPLESDRRTIFDWSNLVGACDGGSGTARHCDALQGSRILYINPALIRSLDQHVYYNTRGQLFYDGPPLYSISPSLACSGVHRSRDEIQGEFDDILGLNIERLKKNRAAIIDVTRERMRRIGWSRANVEREIQHWSAVEGEGHKPYFCVAVSYLERKLPAQP